MKNINKVVLLSIVGFLLIGSYLTSATAQEPPVDTPVNQNQYKGSIAGNETHQFTFKNRFQFRLKTNASINLDMDVDVDGVGKREFELELSTQERVELTIRINESDDNLSLVNGSRIKARNQNRFQYRERFRLNISCNGTVQAKLSVNTNDPQAKWAYYDEKETEWVVVEESTYQNGVLSVETDHFSVWTILTPEENSTSIPGYIIIGFTTIGSIMGLLVIIKKKK